MNYYHQESFLTTPIGNNAVTFDQRKEKGSDGVLRVPPMMSGTIDDVKIYESATSYEYISDKDRLISSCGLESLVHISYGDKDITIIDNHNHAFYCRWQSYLSGKIPRGTHLIHIDQHTDLNELSLGKILPDTSTLEVKHSIIDQNSGLSQVADYANEVLDIASFIIPVREIGLISDYEMILTEYSLLQFKSSLQPTGNSLFSYILDIDLDFWAPEMGIEYYYQTIKKVKELISLPHIRCITIATSPTYIHQQRALEVLRDLMG